MTGVSISQITQATYEAWNKAPPAVQGIAALGVVTIVALGTHQFSRSLLWNRMKDTFRARVVIGNTPDERVKVLKRLGSGKEHPYGGVGLEMARLLENIAEHDLQELRTAALTEPDALKYLVNALSDEQREHLAQSLPASPREVAEAVLRQLAPLHRSAATEAVRGEIRVLPARLAQVTEHLINLLLRSSDVVELDNEVPVGAWAAWSRLTFYWSALTIPYTTYKMSDQWITSVRVRCLAAAVFTGIAWGTAYLYKTRRVYPAPDRIGETGYDMVARARNNDGEFFLGRKELVDQLEEACIRRLSPGGRQNPMLTGKAGVGKTAIVEELARRIANGTCRPELRGIKIYSVSGAELARWQGTELANIEKQIRALKGRCLVFVDEMHAICKGEDKTLPDNLKKQITGDLAIIGATTDKEFKRYFAKNSDMDALVERMDRIDVPAPTDDELWAILSEYCFRRVPWAHIEEETLWNLINLCKEEAYSHRGQPRLAVNALDKAIGELQQKRNFRPSASLVALQNEFARACIAVRAPNKTRELMTKGSHLLHLERDLQQQEEIETSAHEKYWAEVDVLMASIAATDEQFRQALGQGDELMWRVYGECLDLQRDKLKRKCEHEREYWNQRDALEAQRLQTQENRAEQVRQGNEREAEASRIRIEVLEQEMHDMDNRADIKGHTELTWTMLEKSLHKVVNEAPTPEPSDVDDEEISVIVGVRIDEVRVADAMRIVE